MSTYWPEYNNNNNNNNNNNWFEGLKYDRGNQ